MQLYTIETGFFKLDGGAMFGVVPKSIWNKLNPADDNNLCTWAMRSLLIEDGNKLILIDTGIGNKQDDKFFSHYYLHGNDSLDKSLEKLGFHKNDITDVVLTHLHFDHCGGSIIRENDLLKPAFPNAIFWSNEAHWKWATQPNAREKASFLKENILPMQESGQLKLIDLPKEKIENQLSSSVFNDAISVRFVQGHTDQMMLPQIKYKDKTIVFMADLLPSVAHLPLPYVMGYDMFPLTTLKEKQVFLEEAANNNYTLFFQHDPTVECCSLQITEFLYPVIQFQKLRLTLGQSVHLLVHRRMLIQME
ncbi:MAG: MBL fold metallo-hydrolase [Sediminibacterium sp.]|nr:MBL fold metallo-hydrolase [Sediminibacterium sp.]